MIWRIENQKSIWICYTVNLIRFLHKVMFVRIFVRCQCIIFSIFAVNQNASINKNSKSSNSRNLKQHTLAKSISFCFCFVLRNRSFHYIDLQISSRSRFSFKIFILVIAYIYSHLLAHFLFSHLSFHVYRSHLLWVFQLQQWFVTIFTFQSMIFFAISIDRKNKIVISRRSLKQKRK